MNSEESIELGSETLDIAAISNLSFQLLAEQPGLHRDEMEVILYPEIRYQEFAAVGGSFNEIGGKLVKENLPDDLRAELMHKLFSEDEANLAFCRIPMGANDFALDEYSLNDHTDDFDMEHFSMARDEQYLIPYIKAAQAVNPELQFHASPWSPPDWMKVNGSMLNGQGLRDDPEVYRALALYFARFYEEYKKRGIEIERFMIQNEGDRIAPPYPSCAYTANEMARFASEFLAPVFNDRNVPSEIWAGTFHAIVENAMADALSRSELRKVVQGVGVQYMPAFYIAQQRMLYPELKFMHTEADCYDGSNSWAQAVAQFYNMVDYFNAGCSAFTAWNMVLDETGKSTWGWAQNSLASIDRQTNTFTLNPEYHLLRLFGRHLQPGAQLIDSYCRYSRMLAFRNPDGTCKAFVLNWTDSEKKVNVICGSRENQQTLAPRSFNVLSM